MRDIPMFVTEFGVASLTLSQKPYTSKAYIRIQSSMDPEEFLQECIGFCVAAGAEEIYATGHDICKKYPEYTKILSMQASIDSVGDTDAALFPITEDTLNLWLEIYNSKMKTVPNGAWKTLQMGRDLLKEGGGYFIHRDKTLLGIGKILDNQICWVASVQSGAGIDVVRGLCHGVFADTVVLEVASKNEKAINLYEKLGFVATGVLSEWYRIK